VVLLLSTTRHIATKMIFHAAQKCPDARPPCLPAGKGNAADERFSAALSFGNIPDHPESSSRQESWMTKSFFETYFNTQINSWIPASAGMMKLTNVCHPRENRDPVDFPPSWCPYRA
jgi:hypothetical protein